MAAIRSRVTPVCLRYLLRQAEKPSRGSRHLSNIWNHLQKSNLHTGFDGHSPATRILLGRRHHGKFLWVNAMAVRHNSSQIPPEGGFIAAPVVEAYDSTPILDFSPVSPSADHIVVQPITEQVAVETVSMAVPVADTSAVPPVLQFADPTPVLTQSVIEQVADAAPTAVQVLQAVATEPRLTELGLGRYTPVGFLQNLLEFIHVDVGLPWWGAIVVGTALIRIAMFPLMVKSQREAAKLNNVLPEFTKLSTKMNEAKQSGNRYEFAKAYSDLNLFQKKHDVNPLRSFLFPLVQTPVFLCFFFALRNMAHLPVSSLQTGGTLWFTDLTAGDPYFILPLLTTGTMFLILELGAESGISNPNTRALKTMFRIMPFVLLPFMINFPTALFTYWMTSNVFSLCQLALLRRSFVRQMFKLPERISHPASALPQSGGFIESIKKGWKNAQLAHQLEERERRMKNHMDLAAKGPLRQTFKHNPLQQAPPRSAASAKNKSARRKSKGTVV